VTSKIIVILLSVLCMDAFTAAYGQQTPEDMDLYLLIGQSNMAGRGKADELTSEKNEQIWVINGNDEWILAQDPLHYDKPLAVGVGPGLSFAREILTARPEKPIGLIPCAVGGSGIDDWITGRKHQQTGIYAYDAMKARVQEAVKNGTIKGILWHQGESDSDTEKVVVYEEKLTNFFEKLREEINVKRAPLIIGTLGDFYVEKNPTANQINQILTDYAVHTKNCYLVLSSGLTDLGDKTHFDTKSARELGMRYAEAFLKAKSK
jgi:hypothetical protein